MTNENTAARAAGTPSADARARAEQRLQGLPPDALARLRQAGQHVTRGELAPAEEALRAILATHRDHAETLRLYAVVCQLRGRNAQAAAAAAHAARLRPGDALVQNTLGAILREAGDMAGATAAFRRACELEPDLSTAWFNLGMLLQSQADIGQAQAAFARAVAVQPDYVMARVANAIALKALGRTDEAVAELRAAIASDARAASAWAALADIKTVTLDADDLAAMRCLHEDASLGDDERAAVGFALAKALEDQARYPEAFATFVDANAAMRRAWPWDAAAHSRGVDAIAEAFAKTPAPAPDPSLGREAVFIVSLPRAGSTLAEQILAAHPDVEGAGEINDLALIIQDESRRRGESYPGWIGQATPADWERLGREYLARTERWRRSKRMHVDKALFNWPFLGAAAAMLPGARFVNVRRDPVETCWSCFKQRFARGQQVYSYDLSDLGAYWIDYDRLMYFWHARLPGRLYEFVYERLLADAESEIRRLLDFCGLPFASSCLRFHESDRIVRSASAAQVRQPLRADTARTQNYGELLAPLRRALGL